MTNDIEDPSTPQLCDVHVVSFDGQKGALVFSVWSPHFETILNICASYSFGGKIELELPDMRGVDAYDYVVSGEYCVQEAHEALMYQRDLNREAN